MNDGAVIALSPETVLSELKKNSVTHVVWLPDSETTRPQPHSRRTEVIIEHQHSDRLLTI